MLALPLHPCYSSLRFISFTCPNLLLSRSFSKSTFFPNPSSLSLPHRKSPMSSNAFAALMSGARAAAAKKKPQSQSQSQTTSPKKRKTLDHLAKTLALLESPKSPPIPDSNQPVNNQDSSNEPKFNQKPASKSADLKGTESKKSRAENRVAELKSKISLLKKKAGQFRPETVTCCEKGENVPFIFLSLAFNLIANETGRIVITDVVCIMLRTVMDTTPEDLVAVVYLFANKVAPAHEGLELGNGEAAIIKALAEACGRTEKEVKKHYKDMGDLGLVAKASHSSQSTMRKPDPLTIEKVFSVFRLIAKESGKDSQDKKKNHIKSLLVAATDCEPQYLVRLLQTKLRIGLAEQTLFPALGQAAVYNEKHSKPPSNIQSPLEEAAKIVKQVHAVVPVYDKIVPALLGDGVWNLPKTWCFTPGVPVGPMLAKPTKGVSEIVNKFHDTEFTCEYKYDGERAQIHYMEDGSVEIYSQNAERNTGKFPDVVVAISRLKKSHVTSFILDCEIVGYDREKMNILPFQILSTRARKNVAISDIKVDVCNLPSICCTLMVNYLFRKDWKFVERECM